MTLTADHVDWLALLWVHQGGVVTYRGIYLGRDRPLPRFLFPELLLDVLVADGLLAVAQPDDQGRARVSLTETGGARLVQLCEQLAGQPMPRFPRAFVGAALLHDSPEFAPAEVSIVTRVEENYRSVERVDIGTLTPVKSTRARLRS